MKKEVEKVAQDLAQCFNIEGRMYCGYVDGKVASFCIIEDGYVGTLPAFAVLGNIREK